MKQNKEFIKKNIAGSTIIIAVGSASRTFNGMININSCGEFIWDLLENDVTIDDIVDALLQKYNVDEPTARHDVTAFITTLTEAGAVDK